MRNELNELIRAIVNTRFCVENVADAVVRDLRQGSPTTYRGQEWGREHYEVMEKVHLGVEAAWQYAKWLQFPEVESRLTDGFALLARVMDVQEMISLSRLTSSESYVASPAAIEGSVAVVDVDAKETVVTRMTVAELAKLVEELQEQVDQHVETLNGQIADLEERLDEIEDSGDKRGKRGRQMTPEERKAAGERMQLGRARKLGLESVEQLRALKLRPGQKPTKAQISQVKKAHPAT